MPTNPTPQNPQKTPGSGQEFQGGSDQSKKTQQDRDKERFGQQGQSSEKKPGNPSDY